MREADRDDAREIDDRLRLGDGVIQVGEDAAKERGGEIATLSMIDAAVAESNQACQNSPIGLRLRLAGTVEGD